MTVDRLPVLAFKLYFVAAVNINLLRADVSFKGQLSFTQTPGSPVGEVAGDVGLNDFKANSLVPSEDLLAWKASILRGLKVALAPAKPIQVDVRETVLTNFFVRAIVTPEGRINLQDLLKSVATGATATSAGASGVNVVSGSNGSNGSNTQGLSSTANATKSIATDDLGSSAPGLNDVKKCSVSRRRGCCSATRHQLWAYQYGQWFGAVFKPFRQTQLLCQFDGADRQAQCVFIPFQHGHALPGRPQRRD